MKNVVILLTQAVVLRVLLDDYTAGVIITFTLNSLTDVNKCRYYKLY